MKKTVLIILSLIGLLHADPNPQDFGIAKITRVENEKIVVELQKVIDPLDNGLVFQISTIKPSRLVDMERPNIDLNVGDWVMITLNNRGYNIERMATRYAALKKFHEFKKYSVRKRKGVKWKGFEKEADLVPTMIKFEYASTLPKPSADHPDPLQFKPEVFYYDKKLPNYRYRSNNGIPKPSCWAVTSIYTQILLSESARDDLYFDVATRTVRNRHDNELMCRLTTIGEYNRYYVKCKDVDEKTKKEKPDELVDTCTDPDQYQQYGIYGR